MARILIGSAPYIIDSADSGSTSTTTGVKLRLDPTQPLSPQISHDEHVWPAYYAFVTAASEAALKTAVDTLESAILNASGQTIVYEETSGTTLFQMHANLWPYCEGAVEKEQGQLTAKLAFSWIGRREGPTSNGATDEPGLQSPPSYEYVISPGGIAGMTAQAVFGPTMSGTTVTTGARENAEAWIEKMKTSSNWPAWLSAAFRHAGATVEFERKQNVATENEAAYLLARATILFVETSATLHADATFPSTVVKANFNVAMNERDAISLRAATLPGFDVTLYGDLTIKTEGNTAFLSNDTSVTDANIYSTAETAIASIITMFRAMYASLQPTQWGLPTIGIDEPNGLVTFAVRFTGNVTIFVWEEETKVRNIQPKSHSRASDGTEFKYAMAGGPIRTCHHRLKIVATNAIPYRFPPLDDNWDDLETGVDATTTMVFNNGAQQFVTEGESLWRYVNPGPQGTSSSSKSSAGILVDIEKIGSGKLA